MTNGMQGRSARYVEWAVRRNPTYLLSAGLMAVGARLFLVGPSDTAGDVKLILLTLAVLQAYEWAVGGILLLLHRAKRSPEDKPSLLLVAALFWTGPMAATIEMTALRPDLGTSLAAGACVIALTELRLISRILGLKLTAPGQLMGAACMVLLAVAAPLLRIPETASGTNELFLYGAWWALSGVVLICLWALRTYRRMTPPPGPPGTPPGLGQELAFLAMTTAATAAHLIGMNHAFYCHAAPFYSSPLIVVASVVGMDFLSVKTKRSPWLLAAFGVLPGVAILLSFQRFDVEVPVILLPRWLRDPVLSTALIAGAAWWFGYFRHGAIALFHAGVASFGVAAFRVVNTFAAAATTSQGLWVAVLYVGVAYLVLIAWLRRSRTEALVALAIHQAAIVQLVWGKTPADDFVICLVAGWSVLAGLHLVMSRPKLLVRLVPVTFLAIAPWICASTSQLRWQAGAHAAVMILILLIMGHLWRWTRYRSVAVLLVAAHVAALVGRWTTHGPHPTATALVGAGFALLVVGALISWYKARLLNSIRVRDTDNPPEQANT